MVKAKEAPKLVNPYAQPTLIKNFNCNQMGHYSSDCPLRKVVHLAEREDGDDTEVFYEPDGYGDDKEVYEEEEDERQNYVVRKLMLTPNQEESTQRH